MSFEYAPVSKGFMIAFALTSIFVGLFDVKHYLQLQLVPHISRHHQYWRLGIHHLAFSNSSDLFIAELLLYNFGVPIERQFGSVKFASFAFVSTVLGTLLEFISLILFHRLGLNYIPSGPTVLIFSALYQYWRIVPWVYQFRVFGVPLNNKSFIYVVALQLATSHIPGSAAAAIIGIVTGQIYRSDLANLKAYRLPPSVVNFSVRFLLPLIGSIRAPRRSNRAFPDDSRTTSIQSNQAAPQDENDEVITTARPPTSEAATARGRNNTMDSAATGTSVVREWVDGLTGRADRVSAGFRIPTESELNQLTSMFPDIRRETLYAALERSPSIEVAVETVLRSQQ